MVLDGALQCFSLWAIMQPRVASRPLLSHTIALCAESEVRKAVERSSYAVALKFRVFFLFLKSVKF